MLYIIRHVLICDVYFITTCLYNSGAEIETCSYQVLCKGRRKAHLSRLNLMVKSFVVNYSTVDIIRFEFGLNRKNFHIA